MAEKAVEGGSTVEGIRRGAGQAQKAWAGFSGRGRKGGGEAGGREGQVWRGVGKGLRGGG